MDEKKELERHYRDKYDRRRNETQDGEDEMQDGADETQDGEDAIEADEDERVPLTPDAASSRDDNSEVTDLTGPEEKVLKRLRSQRSDYSNAEKDEEEKEDMNVNVKMYTELSPLDHWTTKDKPSFRYKRMVSEENAYKSPKEDVYSIDLKPLQLSNQDPPPEADGLATTSFIEQPEERPDRRIYLPRGGAPRASIEDYTDLTENAEKKAEPSKEPEPYTAPGYHPGGEVMELRDIQLHDMERAGPPEEEVEAFECTSLGWFNCVGTMIMRMHTQLCTANSSLSRTKRILGILLLVIMASLIIFVGLFSVSFEYVNYYNIALKQSRMTGVIDRDTVIYPGCYVLGPDVDLVYFDSTAQTIFSKVSVFTSDKLVIDVDISLQYFLRPEEVGKLHATFGMNYHEVFESLVDNTIKNEGTKHSLEVFRLSRPQLEKAFFQKVKERLGGTCCPRCCPGSCYSNTVCSACEPQESCDQAYHIDIDYFQLGQISIPSEVFERFMKQIILLIENEREAFNQEHAVEVKKTEREAELLVNEANEIKKNATAYGKTVELIAEADKEAKIQLSYISALKGFYKRLNLTVEDHKLSLMMIRAYEDMKDNLFSYGFDKMSLRGSH